MDKELLQQQLKYIRNQYQQTWFTRPSLRAKIQARLYAHLFTEASKDKKAFKKYLHLLVKNDYLDEYKQSYRITKKAVEYLDQIALSEAWEKTRRVLTYLHLKYNNEPFTYSDISKVLSSENEPDFKDCFIGAKSFDVLMQLAVESKYVEQRGNEYKLTKAGVKFLTTKKQKQLIEKKVAFTKDELINLVMGELFEVSTKGNNFNKADYDVIKTELIYLADFYDSWKSLIGDPINMGDWLKHNSYISLSRAYSRKDLYHINLRKWKPSEEQKTARQKKREKK